MDRRAFVTLLGGSIVAPQLAAGAQQTGKMWRIGVLGIGSPTGAWTFRQALRDLGYVEGRNVVIEDRIAEGRLDRLPDYVIVASGVEGTRAAKEATGTIPIVMLATDPVGAGLIGSLAKPGGNITGVATLESELGAKRLEHFHEAFPTATRVAVLYDPMTSATVLNEMEDGARRLKLELQVLEVRAPEDMDAAFKKATQWRAAALSVLASPFFRSQRVRIAQLAVHHRLPSMAPHRAYVESGALLSYGPDFRDLNRRTAVYVDKILKGAKPADLPVEQPTKFELVINLKTAKALGLTIPQSLLLRADQVIE